MKTRIIGIPDKGFIAQYLVAYKGLFLWKTLQTPAGPGETTDKIFKTERDAQGDLDYLSELDDV